MQMPVAALNISCIDNCAAVQERGRKYPDKRSPASMFALEAPAAAIRPRTIAYVEIRYGAPWPGKLYSA